MNLLLKPYAVVRVKCLVATDDDYDGWCVNKRPPAVGDVGTLLEILTAPDLPDRYVVDGCTADGMTVALGDFPAKELKPVEG
jgi:hypothetical protein